MMSMPKIETEWQRFDALTTAALYDLLRFRQSVFVVEQGSAYPDLDGLDQSAWHLLLQADGALVGCARLIPSPLRIGRLAVASHLRRDGIGRMLMEQALSFCRERYPAQPIALAAQVYLMAFYESFGFAAVSEPYDEFGVLHVEMRLQR